MFTWSSQARVRLKSAEKTNTENTPALYAGYVFWDYDAMQAFSSLPQVLAHTIVSSMAKCRGGFLVTYLLLKQQTRYVFGLSTDSPCNENLMLNPASSLIIATPLYIGVIGGAIA